MVAGAIMQSTGCTFNKLRAEAARLVGMEKFLLPLMRVKCRDSSVLTCARGSHAPFFMTMTCDLDPWSVAVAVLVAVAVRVAAVVLMVVVVLV